MDMLHDCTVPCAHGWLDPTDRAHDPARVYEVARARLLCALCGVDASSGFVIRASAGDAVAGALQRMVASVRTDGPPTDVIVEAERALLCLQALHRAIDPARTRTRTCLLWAWPRSVLGTGSVVSTWTSADELQVRAHLAWACMQRRALPRAMAQWRAVLLAQERWDPFERAAPELPGWYPRLAAPELNAHVVHAMLHVCRSAHALYGPEFGESALPTGTQPRDTSQRRSIDAATRALLRAPLLSADMDESPQAVDVFLLLGRTWCALAHAHEAVLHLRCSWSSVRRAGGGGSVWSSEYTAGVRPSVVAVCECLRAQLGACVSVLAGVYVSKVRGRHVLGARLARDSMRWARLGALWGRALDHMAAQHASAEGSVVAEDRAAVLCGMHLDGDSLVNTCTLSACEYATQSIDIVEETVRRVLRGVGVGCGGGGGGGGGDSEGGGGGESLPGCDELVRLACRVQDTSKRHGGSAEVMLRVLGDL